MIQQRAVLAPVSTTPVAHIAPPQPVASPQPASARTAPAPASQSTAPVGVEQAEIDRNIAKLEALTAAEPAAVARAPAPAAPATAVQTAPAATARRSTPAAAPAPSSAPAIVATAAPRPAKPTPPAAVQPRPSAAQTTQTANNLQPNSERFIGWGNREYTIQLVAAGSPASFASFAQQVGLDLETLHQVRLQQPEQTWWLLCYGRYDSLDSAKLAIAQLPNNARSSGAWPRRVGPLQAEQTR